MKTIPSHRYLVWRLASVTLIWLGGMTDVWAHAFLEKAVPAVGGKVSTSPPELKIRFTEAVEGNYSRVQVFDASDKEVDKKDSHVDPKDAHVLIVSLSAPLGAGSYKVVWRAVSVDTHVTTGDYTFRVAP